MVAALVRHTSGQAGPPQTQLPLTGRPQQAGRVLMCMPDTEGVNSCVLSSTSMLTGALEHC